MEGPADPFEDGLAAVTGPALVPSFPLEPGQFSLVRADFKYFLSEFHAQGPAFLALELRPQIRLADLQSIEIATYHFAWFEIGSGPEKWNPMTRETADHSMPYVVAAVLIDGAYTDAIFAPERFRDPRTLDLMKKITISEDAEFNKRYPNSLPWIDNFHRLAGRTLPRQRLDAILERLWGVGREGNLHALFDALRLDPR
jgi:2-methylcitrate dehydratase